MFEFIVFISESTYEAQAFNVFFSLFFWFSFVSYFYLAVINILKRG